MHFLSSTRFELTGEFTGFVRNREGKRRMLLRVEESELLTLKLPKELRKRFETVLQPGTRVAVLGIEYRDFAGDAKYVVSYLRVMSPAPAPAPAATPAPAVAIDACAKCTIRVCAKKNCWKDGGKEVFERLRARVTELGLQEAVDVKAVGCLDNCKRGPNVECGKKLFEKCDASSVDEIVDRATKRIGERV